MFAADASDVDTIPGPIPDDILPFTKCNELPTGPCILDGTREIYRRTEEHLASIDDQIMRLEAQRKVLRDNLSSCRSILSLIRRLPSEVLGLIFDFFAMEESFVCFLQREPTFRKPPWVLGLVCRRWRWLVESYPHLWTTFVFNRPWEALRRRGAERIAVQLERCSDKAILLSIFLSGTWTSDYTKILDLLCANDRIWSHLDTTLFDTTLQFFFGAYHRPLRGLRALHLKLIENRAISSGNNNLVLCSLPGLRRLSTFGTHSLFQKMQIPWKNLTHYNVGDSYNSSHYRILPMMKNLLVCRLACTSVKPPLSHHTSTLRGKPETPIVLPSLHTLTLITLDGSSGIADLLDSVCLPALRVLCLYHSDGKHNSRAMVDLIKRSGCSIRELALGGLADGNDVATSLASGLLGSISSLTMSYSSDPAQKTVPGPPLGVLTRDGSEVDSFPRLTYFETNIWRSPPVELLDMLQSRCDANTGAGTIRRLVLEDPDRWSTAPDSSCDSFVSSCRERVGKVLTIERRRHCTPFDFGRFF